MAQLKNTTINGTLSLNAYSGIADVEKYLADLTTKVNTALQKRVAFPDYSKKKIVIAPTTSQTSYTFTEDGFVIMGVESTNTTCAWYAKLNGVALFRMCIYQNGKAADKQTLGPYPVKKGDVITVYGGVNITTNSDGTGGIIFIPLRTD